MTTAHEAVARTARTSYGRLLAYLAVRSRDLVACEDALSEAFAAALRTWPERGIPDQPDAWLLAVARRRLVDQGRHAQVRERAVETLIMRATEVPETDERLPLLFVCAHPAIDVAARTPLMLQVVLGLDAATIARAFLVSPASMAKRLVRAKQKIKRAGIPFEVPEREHWAPRLAAVLDAIYAAFARDFDLGAAPEDPTLAQDRHREALHLAEVVTGLLPDEPEALGLLALLCHVDARRIARRDSEGGYVPLDQQDPTAWDAGRIQQAEKALRRAAPHAVLGRFQLEAAIQSCHVARHRDGVDTRAEVVELYATLVELTGTVGAALGHAAAMATLHGPKAGLTCLDTMNAPQLQQHQPWWAVRADLLRRAGDPKADEAYEKAIALTQDPAARQWLQDRQATQP
ncbi:MAG: DUF6596 domain-containing protein [Myxococcota bacterium]